MKFIEFLQVLFIILKVANIIDWSWWWVFSPLWIPAIVTIIVIIILIIIGKNIDY